MVHTPCEGNKEKAYCRKGSKPWWPKCSKRFPHDFLEETAFVEDGYVQLRRPNDGVTVKKFCKDLKKEVEADNRHVVAYSPFLLLKFKCHINVELTNSIRSCKYIFKYLFSKWNRFTSKLFFQRESTRLWWSSLRHARSPTAQFWEQRVQ